MKNLLLSFSICLIALLCLYGCTKKDEPTPSTTQTPPTTTTPSTTGKYAFWVKKDYGVGEMDVYVEGSYVGTISHFSANGISCEKGDADVTISRNAGTYSYQVIAQTGEKISGTITIGKGACSSLELIFTGTQTTTPPVTTPPTTTPPSSTPTTGSATFWTSQSSGWGSIDVYVSGVFAGTITKYNTSTPTCGTSGLVTVVKSPGTYAYTAKSNTGATWSGNVTISANGCYTMRLDFPAGTGTTTGSQVMFWTNTNKYGKIDVYVNNVLKGTITSYFSSAPACGSSGCVTVPVSGTNNTWVAKAGTYSWSGNYTLENGCNTLLLK